MRHSPRFIFTLLVCLFFPRLLPASGPTRIPVGFVETTGSSIRWQVDTAAESVLVTVAAPDGRSIRREFPGSNATLRMREFGEALLDGQYTWELRLVPQISGKTRKRLAESRAAGDDEGGRRIQAEAGLSEPLVQSGTFLVVRGSIVSAGSEEPAGLRGRAASDAHSLRPEVNDQVIADDLIVQGSGCFGFDCINGESFGTDTIRLKENVLRIRFEDTSTTAGYPSNDWEIAANGANVASAPNQFTIGDITGARTPFLIEAGAPTDSIHVTAGGRLGLRTATPDLDLQISTGNTPAHRLEQTPAGGYAAQTWDIAGNEANFFVRDVTGGSRLPFRIRPGAPTSAIDIAGSGFVGIGTASPKKRLHIMGSVVDTFPAAALGVADMLVVENSGNTNVSLISSLAGNATIRFVRSGQSTMHGWLTYIHGSDAMTFGTAAGEKLRIDWQGNVGLTGVVNPVHPIQHASGAHLSAGGAWVNASSRTLKEGITTLEAAEALETLKGLDPVKYSYSADPDEQHVGFIAEDVPGLVATSDRKSLSTMDIVAVLTSVIQEQQKTIETLEKRLVKVETRDSPRE